MRPERRFRAEIGFFQGIKIKDTETQLNNFVTTTIFYSGLNIDNNVMSKRIINFQVFKIKIEISFNTHLLKIQYFIKYKPN